MIATASIAKHPLHPMLIPLPIGLWIFSLACDFIFVGTGNGLWGLLALYSMAGGILGALLAALPGLVDLFTLDRSPVKTIGIWHMSINLTVVLLYAVNFFWRSNTELGYRQMALSLVAVLLLAVSGWLGGEMVYVHGVGVEPVDRRRL